MTDARPKPAWWLVVSIVVIDQITKHWAVNRLSGGRIIDLVGSLRLNLTYNRGMAFSQGTNAGPFIGAFALVAIVAIVWWLRRSAHGVPAWAGVLVLSGAIGNVLDRLFRGDAWLRGAVIDFVDLQWWPVFNVADVAISCGALLMIVTALRKQPAT
jgi:signal peptidase II